MILQLKKDQLLTTKLYTCDASLRKYDPKPVCLSLAFFEDSQIFTDSFVPCSENNYSMIFSAGFFFIEGDPKILRAYTKLSAAGIFE